MIKILTPLKYNYIIPDECKLSIENQSILAVRYCCDVNKCVVDLIPEKRESEIKNRNDLLKLIEQDDIYVLLMDADVCLTSNTDIEDMIIFLESHPELDACALDTKDVGSIYNTKKYYHVVIACCMVRAQKLINYQFTADSEHCGCVDFNNNFNIDYVDSRKLKEIKG